MLWIAYQLFRDIISHHLLFLLNGSPCQSRGTGAEPSMSSFQTHLELQDDPSAVPQACSEPNPHTDRFLCPPRVPVPCSLLARDGNPQPLWAGFGSIASVLNAWHMVQGAGVTWGGQGMVWFGFGHGTQHCSCCCWPSAGLFSAWEAGHVCCVPYPGFQQEVVRERAASFVTVVALNRKWLIFHGYFFCKTRFLGECISLTCWREWACLAQLQMKM